MEHEVTARDRQVAFVTLAMMVAEDLIHSGMKDYGDIKRIVNGLVDYSVKLALKEDCNIKSDMEMV